MVCTGATPYTRLHTAVRRRLHVLPLLLLLVASMSPAEAAANPSPAATAEPAAPASRVVVREPVSGTVTYNYATTRVVWALEPPLPGRAFTLSLVQGRDEQSGVGFVEELSGNVTATAASPLGPYEFEWKHSMDLEPHDNYYVHIVDNAVPELHGWSAPFAIAPATFEWLSPAAAETWYVGQQHFVRYALRGLASWLECEETLLLFRGRREVSRAGECSTEKGEGHCRVDIPGSYHIKAVCNDHVEVTAFTAAITVRTPHIAIEGLGANGTVGVVSTRALVPVHLRSAGVFSVQLDLMQGERVYAPLLEAASVTHGEEEVATTLVWSTNSTVIQPNAEYRLRVLSRDDPTGRVAAYSPVFTMVPSDETVAETRAAAKTPHKVLFSFVLVMAGELSLVVLFIARRRAFEDDRALDALGDDVVAGAPGDGDGITGNEEPPLVLIPMGAVGESDSGGEEDDDQWASD